MTSKCTFLPNLSQLSLYGLDQIPVNAKRKHTERENYEFPAAGIQITEVDWKAVRETLKMDARYQPADTQGYPAYKLTFYKSGTDTPLAVHLVMTNIEIKMMSTDGWRCFRVEFPKISAQNIMYISDLFYDAHREKLECDMAPQYGETSGSVDLLLNSMTIIASKLGNVIKLTDASRFRRGIDTIFIPSTKPEMTDTLRLKRGYSYYDARGFLPYLIDLAILKELQLGQNDMSRSHEYFLQAFQINLNWIHLWMTTPLNALESKVPEFISSVDSYESTPLIMKQLFVAAGDRFNLSRTSLSYLIKDLDEKDTGLKEKSMRQLVYEMDVPNPLYQERSNKDASFSTFMSDVETFMDLIDVVVNINDKEVKLQDRKVTQRTFQILDNDDKCSIQRVRVSVPGGSDGRPRAELVEVDTDIRVLGMKENVWGGKPPAVPASYRS